MDAVSGYLANSLGLVKAYNDISLNVNDRFLSTYETEFFSDYKIFDADADISPFDEYHQKLLEYTLEAVEYAIENVGMDADCKKELLTQAADLKTRIPTLKKNQVALAWSRFSAKLKLLGPDVKNAVLEEAKKQLVKILFEHGWRFLSETIPRMIHHLMPH